MPGIPGGNAADSAGRALQGFPVLAPRVLLWGSVLGPCRVLPSYLSRPLSAQEPICSQGDRAPAAVCCASRQTETPWEQKCDLCQLPLYLARVCWEAPEKTLARGLSEWPGHSRLRF